jgi:hypothetical protein
VSLQQRRTRLLLLAVTGALLGAGCEEEARRARDPDPTKAMFADFAKRVDEYVALRNRLADSVGELDPSRSQAEIAARAAALGTAIVAARPRAKPGDIFTPEVASVLATLIKQEYGRRSAHVQETRDDQQEELPAFEPHVNALYPTSYPLATFPPNLLPLLPPLPEALEYRFVGDYLVRRDVEANLIVDFMPGALPAGG